jgi:hypothetical protein
MRVQSEGRFRILLAPQLQKKPLALQTFLLFTITSNPPSSSKNRCSKKKKKGGRVKNQKIAGWNYSWSL